MSLPKFEIHGWKSDGPVYTKRTYLTGRRNRHNRFRTETVGEKRGANIQHPAYEVVYSDNLTEIYAFNRGYEYEVIVLIDGFDEEEIVSVPAEDEYQIIEIPLNIEIVDIVSVREDENSAAGDDGRPVDDREASTS